MTAEEVMQVFNTQPHSVPEYDVMPFEWPRLHKRGSRSATKIRLNAFGRNVNLWLNPVEGVLFSKDTPVYLANYKGNDYEPPKLTQITNAMDTIGKLYEDQNKKASLLVKRSTDGATTISGHVASEGWVVKPLPQHLSSRLRNRRSIDDFSDLKNITAGDYEPEYHVIFKNPVLSDEANYTLHHIMKSKTSRSKRSVPNVIYPQVFVVVDYGTYRLHGENLFKMIEYLVPFWNGVDLRYRSLEFPKVRLNIAGIMIAADSKVLPYVRDSFVSAYQFNVLKALKSFRGYMRVIEPYVPLDSYDLAITMVPYDMCSLSQNVCKTGTLGLAYVGGACNYDKDRPETSAVSIVQDKGAFDGMHTAAHEMGHLFGVNHDDPKVSLCSGTDGYIMSPSTLLTENSADWSPCSLKEFEKFFNGKGRECLYNKPKTIKPLPRLLPGRSMSMDEQCAATTGTRSCKIVTNVCMQLGCIRKGDERWCESTGYAPADGSPCGEGKFCLHGQCLDKKVMQ